MPNTANDPLAEADRHFIEDVAQILIPWGVPQTTARIYGYLLLMPEPVSLQRITADLGVSKSSASVAARVLEMYTLARRHSERGSKRILYEASEDYAGTLTGQNRMLRALATLFRSRAVSIDPGITRERLEEIADFYQNAYEAMETAVQTWRSGSSRWQRSRQRGQH